MAKLNARTTPWNNAIRRYHYASHGRLNEHLATILVAGNSAKRLKILEGAPPFEFATSAEQANPAASKAKSNRVIPGTEP